MAPLTPEQARRLFEYNRRVFGRFERKARRLSWRSVSRRREIGHQSILATLSHILNVHEVWMAYIVAGRSSDPELEALFADASRHPKDWAGFARYARRVWAAVGSAVARLAPGDMDRPVKAFWMPGKCTVSDALLQTTLEQAHHLGEVIGVLWQDDVPPPEMTWIRVGPGLAGP